jgi:alpha-L-rhamnosidase
MIEKGATTCWEQWNGYYSQIHSCFPYIGGWFYKGLAGIQWDQKEPGFKNVILRPGLVKSVDWVKCSYESPYGEIVSNWKAQDDVFEWQISIPPNSTATVYIPGIDIRENGKAIDSSQEITFLRREGTSSVYKIPSGSYLLTSNINPNPDNGA